MDERLKFVARLLAPDDTAALAKPLAQRAP
jgi:hypothetical protein